MDRCAKCSTKIRDGGHASPLGEIVCGSCATTINGAALGLMGGGGLGGALAGPGILRWVQRSLRPGRRTTAAPDAASAPDAEGLGEGRDDRARPVVPDP